MLTILGDAGVGKTRLVRELWEWFAAQDVPPLRRTGRCLSYGQGITYWPLAEVLKEHFQILESDSPQSVAGRLGNHSFLGITIGLAPPEDLHPLVARERLHDSWVAFLDGLVAERPTVMLIEDVHWAESDLCDLLETVVSHVDGPLLLLATARPELLDRTGRGGRVGSTGLNSSSRRCRQTALAACSTSCSASRYRPLCGRSSSSGLRATHSSSKSSWRR